MISIVGLKHLYCNLASTSNETINISTRRLNQDSWENCFGTIRIQNGNCINPTCIQFKRTFKKLFCINYFEYSEGANCIEDVLTSIDKMPSEELKIIINAFTYVFGYLIGKCLKVHSCDVCLDFAHATTTLSSEIFFSYFKIYECDTTSMFSSLIMPVSTFYQFVFELDQILNKYFDSLAILPNLGQKLKQSTSNVYFEHSCQELPKEYLLNIFIRFRIYTTLTRTNRYLSLPGKKYNKNRKIQILFHL